MLNLYVAPSSASSRKARQWLKTHHIPFKMRNIKSRPLNANEIIRLLCLTENGCSDIISKRSNVYKKMRRNNIDFENLPLLKLVDLMVKHPGLIRRPILFSKNRMEVGFNEEEIRRFLPHSVRKAEFKRLEDKLRVL